MSDRGGVRGVQCAVLPPDLGADRHARVPGDAESHHIHQVRKCHIYTQFYILVGSVYLGCKCPADL